MGMGQSGEGTERICAFVEFTFVEFKAETETKGGLLKGTAGCPFSALYLGMYRCVECRVELCEYRGGC